MRVKAAIRIGYCPRLSLAMTVSSWPPSSGSLPRYSISSTSRFASWSLPREAPRHRSTRHFMSDKNKIEHIKHKNDSQRRYNVMLFSNVAFNKYLESTRAEIRGKALTAEYHEENIRAVEGEDDTAANKEREEAWKAMERPLSSTRMFRLTGPPQRVVLEATTSSLLPPTSASAGNVLQKTGRSSKSTPLSRRERFQRQCRPDPHPTRVVHSYDRPQSFGYLDACLLRLKATTPDEQLCCQWRARLYGHQAR